MIAAELPGASVRFSTRVGGVSSGPYASLNLGANTDDDRDSVRENRRLLMEQAGLPPGAVAAGHQVHGADVLEWDGPPTGGGFEDPDVAPGPADGHATAVPDLALLVFVADCLPVALASASRVAIAHCGWRGLATGIIGHAVATFGEEEPMAVVGPGIGACCFEVGPEVLERFADVEGAAAGGMLDLRRVAEARLLAAGVAGVRHVDLCTSCGKDLFFSHRRDGGITGRQCGMVWRS